MSHIFRHDSNFFFTVINWIKILTLGTEYQLSMDVIEKSSRVLTKNKRSLLIRIDNFPAFVASKAKCTTRNININNTLWNISLGLRKYCPKTNKYIRITPNSSVQPDTLVADINGQVSNSKQCSFDVATKFKFETEDDESRSSSLKFKLDFNQSNGYKDSPDSLHILAEIDVVFYLYFSAF